MATILLVEPNVAFRRMMEQELRKAGHEVFGADEALTAARALREREFDLVVVEMVIPGDITAADLLAGMRDDPLPGEPSRIAMTAQSTFAQNEAFFRAEYLLDGFLLKPFLPNKLRAAVDEALAARAARRSAPSIGEWNAPGGFVPPPLDAPGPKTPAVGTPAAAIIPPPPPLAVAAAPAPAPAPASAPIAAASVSVAQAEAPPPLPHVVVPPPPPDLHTGDLAPLDTNPGIVDEPAPSPAEFEAASTEDAISLEDLAPPPVQAERRAVKRFSVRVPMALHDGKQPFRGRSENLSRGGLYVVTDRSFAAGARLRVRLELPVPGEGHNEIAVRVVHTEKMGSMSGLGIRFDEMSAETARRLDTFLADLAAPSHARPFLVVASPSLSPEVERVAQSYRDDEVRVRFVEPGENVQQAAESDPPDLMLLDLADPVMVAFVGALKASRATSGIPIALVDKSGQPQSALMAAAAGADRYFSLPGELMALVGFSVEKLAASRRRNVRVRFQRPVSVWAQGAEIRAAAVDLSETGLQVRTAADLPAQTAVEISVALSDGGPPLHLAAKVAWRADAADGGPLGVRLGIVFEPDESVRARIREEVRRALAASYYVRWLASSSASVTRERAKLAHAEAAKAAERKA